MLLGTSRLQDPNGKEFEHLIYVNCLVKANIRSTDTLRKLWASLFVQVQLGKSNTKLTASDPENTSALERQLLQVDETIPGPTDPQREPVEGEPPSQVPVPVVAELPPQRPFVVTGRDTAETLVGSDCPQSSPRNV
jgi:hypothetical protein